MPNYTLSQISSDGLPFVMGYLLPVVVLNTQITYGEIAKLLQQDLALDGRIFSPQIGFVVGTLMDRLHEIDPKIPLINVLVVNQGSRSPGVGADGYLRDRFNVTKDPLPKELKAKLVDRAASQVYDYPAWADVYRKAFGRPAPVIDPLVLVKGTEQDGAPPTALGKRGGEAESKEHKALKAFVLAHPECVDIRGKPNRANDELPLLSGDEVDVFFETGRRVDLIEVKSIRSNWNDLRRGIYQCIKYRAVFQAQREAITPNMTLVCTLVTEVQVPKDISDLAKLHTVNLESFSFDLNRFGIPARL